jgi:hypothetical protein
MPSRPPAIVIQRVFCIFAQLLAFHALQFDVDLTVAGCSAPVRARCTCRVPQRTTADCDTGKVSVSGPIELQDAAAAHIGPAQELRSLPLREAFLSCAEDWGTSDIAGSWGGDAGEMLLALAVSEHSRRVSLTSQQVEQIVRSYISRARASRIYYHTTARAVGWVQAQIGVDELDMSAPPRALQPLVLAALHDPRGQGCTLLKAVLQDPARFHMRTRLAHDFIDAFHNLLWDSGFALREKIAYHVSRDADAYIGRCKKSLGPEGVAEDLCAAEAPFAAMPYGRFTAVLRSPDPLKGLQAARAQARAVSRPRLPEEECKTLVSGSTRLSAAPALINVLISEECMSARRTVLVRGNNGRGGKPWLVLHPQLIGLRRNATVPVLVSALPGSDGEQLRDLLHQWGGEWARAAEEALGVVQRLDALVSSA